MRVDLLSHYPTFGGRCLLVLLHCNGVWGHAMQHSHVLTARFVGLLRLPVSSSVSDGVRWLRRVSAAYATTWRRAFAACTLYDELSSLSIAELTRRGIRPDDISRCVFNALAG
jgi:hypothetical protein